ncbi:ash family protein [Acerihabitans sp. TG2]|uniref:ash family protein n=1 Tax=Acerihabitans sp. TG2 TaxID=3096008 RepID=UPI003A5995AD
MRNFYLFRQKGLCANPPVSYSFRAVAKSTVGRENPRLTMATPHAPSVFFMSQFWFVVFFFTQRYLCHCCSNTMVAQAGQPSGWPGSIVTGFSPLSGLPP